MTTVSNAAPSAAHLPGTEQVGMVAEWVLPAGQEICRVRGDFIGFASTQRQQHEGHSPRTFAPVKSGCRACRWFELRVFREDPDPERYLIHTAGQSIVPGEVVRTRVEWAFSGEEMISALASPYNGRPSKCPVCDGTGLVSRPPGVAGDQRSWPSVSTGPYKCQACNGAGLLSQSTVRFTLPAQRVIAQAASFDDEIHEAWQSRVTA